MKINVWEKAMVEKGQPTTTKSRRAVRQERALEKPETCE